MRVSLLVLLLSLASCLSACGASSTRRGATPAAPDATATPRDGGTAAASTPTPDGRPKIVAFGDSLTAGYGLAPAESYPSLLQRQLDADGYQYEVVNAGVSGDTSAGGVRRLDWSLNGDVRFLILELGANDFLRGQPIAETKKNLTEIIERARARGVRVLLAGMLTTTDAGRGYEQEIHDAFTELARHEGVTLIPFFLEGVAGVERLNQEDRIHPNAEGTRIVARTVYQYLKPLLDEDRRRTQAR